MKNEIESTYRYLMKGQIGKANSCWNKVLPQIADHMQTMKHQQQLDLLPTLQNILQSQENKDWVRMADVLKYELLVKITN